MIRGVRGATTVMKNDEQLILANTKELVEDMINLNGVQPEDVSHVFISATSDLTAAFPAKALRQIPGWVYVPVMCMREMDVPDSLAMCIRVMMITNTTIEQQEIQHIFHRKAKRLRPDLLKKAGVDNDD